MKLKKIRLGVIFIFVVGFSFPSFSTNTEEESGFRPDSSSVKRRHEATLAIGFEYGNFWGRFFDGTQNVKAHRTASAFSAHYHTIREGNTVGFFLHSYAGSPNMGTVNGIRPEYTDYVGEQVGLLFGPLFRCTFNEKLTLLYGVGPNFFITSQGYTQNVPSIGRDEYFLSESFNVGIGVNIALQYAVSSSLLLFAGCILTYDFFRDITLEARPSNPALRTSERVQDFSMFGVRPYVSIGVRL
jgi:hypothetical protein